MPPKRAAKKKNTNKDKQKTVNEQTNNDDGMGNQSQTDDIGVLQSDTTQRRNLRTRKSKNDSIVITTTPSPKPKKRRECTPTATVQNAAANDSFQGNFFFYSQNCGVVLLTQKLFS